MAGVRGLPGVVRVSAVSAAGIVLLGVMAAAPASAAPASAAPPASCAGGVCVVSNSVTSTVEQWTVPTGVSSVHVLLAGAGGRSAGTAAGGKGGAFSFDVSVSAGDVLALYAGGLSAPIGATVQHGAGGSFVFDNGALIAAAGAGGDAANGTAYNNGVEAGGAGGTFGTNQAGGNPVNPSPGNNPCPATGATATGPGSGGGRTNNACTIAGANGGGPVVSLSSAFENGGTQAAWPNPTVALTTGNGGGGYYGGGGGGSSAGLLGGGGGGAGYVDATRVTNLVQQSPIAADAVGGITIRYTQPASAPDPTTPPRRNPQPSAGSPAGTAPVPTSTTPVHLPIVSG